MPQALMVSAVLATVAWEWLDSAHALDRAHYKRKPLFSTSKIVRTLDTSNFDAMLNDTHTVWLVDYYSPWCPHCLQFGPHWEKVATVYNMVDKIQLGAVDCTKQNEICDREGVYSYPGVKMYHVPPESKKAIDMPHGNDVYAQHVVKWIEETLKENDMRPLINVDEVYKTNSKRRNPKKTYKFGDPVEPSHDEKSTEIRLKRLKDAGSTVLLTFEDGFFMGTTELAGERYEAAVMWVQTLADAFPVEQNRAAFVLLVDTMKQQTTWKQMDWTAVLNKWKAAANAMSYPTNLFASKDDLSLCTTSTCGLWTLFHSLTVNADYLQPGQVMKAIRLVVTHFFGCEECKIHFLKANSDSIVEKLAVADEDGSHGVTFWMWLMHNSVNRVLGKPRWPTNLSCPNCYFTTDQPLSLELPQLNLEDIVAYIRSVYKLDANLNIAQHPTTNTSWRNSSMATYGLLIAIFVMIFLQQKYRFVGTKIMKARDHIS